MLHRSHLVGVFALALLGACYAAPAAAQYAFSLGSALSDGVDQGFALAMDRQDNVFILGRFESFVDFDPGDGVTERGAGIGTALYLASYDRDARLRFVVPLRGADVAGGLDVDPMGRVFVSGGFRSTVEFDPDGTGFSLTATAGSRDAFVASYGNDGAFRFAFGIGADSPSSTATDLSYDLAVDDGGVYITGRTDGDADFDPSAADATVAVQPGGGFLAAYDLDGAYRYAYRVPHTRITRLTEPGNGSRLAVATDSDGDVYLTGAFFGDAAVENAGGEVVLRANGFDPDRPSQTEFRDAYVAVFARDGMLRRAFNFGGETSDEYGGAIGVGLGGEIYVHGHFIHGETPSDFDPSDAEALLTTAGRADAFVAQYDALGSYIEAIQIGGRITDGPGDLMVDGNGRVHVAGFFRDAIEIGSDSYTAVGSSDAFYAVFSASLQALQSRVLASPGEDRGNAVAVGFDTRRRFITGLLGGTADLDPDPQSVAEVAGGAVLLGTDADNAILVTDPFIEPLIDTFRFQQNVCTTDDALTSLEPYVPSVITPVVDGNDLLLTLAVDNDDADAVTVQVQFRTGDGRALASRRGDAAVQTLTIPGGTTRLVTFWWDTSGEAWSPEGAPLQQQAVRVEVRDSVGGEVYDQRTATLRIVPKPLVLAHGLWSSAATWADYDLFATAAHQGWAGRTYAVGDGRVTGIMDTGAFTGARTAQSIALNAVELGGYLGRVRAREKACHVDVVAHSMGGLISREYVQELMPPVNTAEPEIRNLVMLGTPNQGSPCADDLIAAGPYSADPTSDYFAMNLYQLTSAYLRGYNLRVTEQRGVRYHILAGHPAPFTCSAQAPGDGVVTLGSALATSSPFPRFTTTATTTSLLHTAMTFDAATFSDFVAPILAARTATSDAHGKASRPNASARLAAGVEQVLAEVVQVESGQTIDMPLYIDGDSLAVLVAAPDSVVFSLLDPSAQARGESAAGTGALFRTLASVDPAAGIWILRLRNTGAALAEVQVGAQVRATPLRMRLSIAADPVTSAATITAIMTDGAAHAAGASIGVRLVGPDASTTFATLLDDGSQGDAFAGDGVYGARIGNLDPVEYAVIARAVYTGAGSVEQQRFAHTALNLAPASFADVSATYTTEARSVPRGETATFKLDLRNAGPARAVALNIEQRLPEGTTVLDARTSTGEPCAIEEARVVCGIGAIAPNTTSVVWVDVLAESVGAIAAEATVTAYNVDPERANNSATDAVTVSMGSGAEGLGEAAMQTRLLAPAPNPVSGTVRLAFEIPMTQHVSVIAYDAIGRQQAVVWDRSTPPGHHVATFDASAWPGGVYVVRLRAGDAVLTQSLVVVP